MIKQISILAALTLTVFLSTCTKLPDTPLLTEDTQHLRNKALGPFYHGVASGDPLATSVIIWTRVTPPRKVPMIDVKWEVATDESFREIVGTGVVSAKPEKDYTVKIDVKKLNPDTYYYYRFRAMKKVSAVGRTRTAPITSDQVKFVVVSCSNYEFGYFNSYGALADETNINAVLHLGDYIYEYAAGIYGKQMAGRINIPAHEIITLKDYRTRYNQYRLDPDLQSAHAMHPFINIWDDHEIANNSYVDGAQNHQEGEGDYTLRKQVARQVFYEWLPIREGAAHYRHFPFGRLVDLIMLDERLEGRSKPIDDLSDPGLYNKNRSLLGKEQLAWFTGLLKSSKAQWKVIGNQVIFSRLDWGYDTWRINLDSWDGYPLEQKHVSDFIEKEKIDNVVFVTGDTHSAWAFEVSRDVFNSYDPVTGKGAIAVEFGATSINSGNANERYDDTLVLEHQKKIVGHDVNPHLKYVNLRDHGYLLLTLSKQNAIADFKFVNTLEKRDKQTFTEQTVLVNSGETKLKLLK